MPYDISSQYDLVLVFPWGEKYEKKKDRVMGAVEKLTNCGSFELFSYLSVQKDEVITCMD